MLPTLGALLGTVACERNPFVSRDPSAGAGARDAGITALQQVMPIPPGTISVQSIGATTAPPLPMPYLGPPPGTIAHPPMPGRYAPPPRDGGSRPLPPGRVLPPSTHDAGTPAPIPPGVVPPPPPPPPPGRPPPPGIRPRPGPPPTRDPIDPSATYKPSPEARADGRRLGRTRAGDGGRDPGCAGAGALRRRGPT